jgi:hypothetical protein
MRCIDGPTHHPERIMFKTSSRLDQRLVGVLLLAWSITGASAIGFTAYEERVAASATASMHASSASAPAVAEASPSAGVAIASAR